MDFTKEEKPTDKEGNEIKDAAPVFSVETRTLNSMTPLWVKNKSEIKPEEYHEFYQNVFHDWNDPLEVIHTKAEGVVEYTALLFIPSHAPFDYYTRDFKSGIKLFFQKRFYHGQLPGTAP